MAAAVLACSEARNILIHDSQSALTLTYGAAAGCPAIVPPWNALELLRQTSAVSAGSVVDSPVYSENDEKIAAKTMVLLPTTTLSLSPPFRSAVGARARAAPADSPTALSPLAAATRFRWSTTKTYPGPCARSRAKKMSAPLPPDPFATIAPTPPSPQIQSRVYTSFPASGMRAGVEGLSISDVRNTFTGRSFTSSLPPFTRAP